MTGEEGSSEGAEPGGREPNVNPLRNPRCPGPGDAEGIGTPSEVGGDVEGNDTSCAPSSAIAVCGSEPGRGKNTDRLRECRRECRRVFEDEDGGEDGSNGLNGECNSGAVGE